jgi:NADH-quinone oxidoreductase subunit A
VSAYWPVAIFLAIIVLFAVGSLAAARLVRPTRAFGDKDANYECGAVPVGTAWVQFPVGFYLVALLFIVFDAAVVFLFPWAVTLTRLGAWGYWAMIAFLGIVSLGWLYAYREGILEWK